MDLHAWITAQVDAIEAGVRAELTGRSVTFNPGYDGRPVAGTVTAVSHGPDGLNLVIAQYGVEPVDATPAPVRSAAAVLRRCEADRRILTRHTLDPSEADSPPFATACQGCGIDTSWGLPNVDNLNDCPELLDLAHAHGITDEILAGLDRPEPPPSKPRAEEAPGLRDLFAYTLGPRTRMADLPPALRGTRWTAHTAT